MTTNPKSTAKKLPDDAPAEFDPSEDRPDTEPGAYERTEATVAEGRPLAD